jgi:co-chaperonin GroES (HSP10)|tara:strand:- start:126 stop:455 length:330 start_codon:yes stop_codon:yes gene_type:complete
MTKTKDPIQAVGKIVILREMEAQTKTASGIIVEGMRNKEPFSIGTVVSVGNGIELTDGAIQVPPVEKGDIVFYDKNKSVIMDGLCYTNSDFIIAVINDESQIPKGYYQV